MNNARYYAFQVLKRVICEKAYLNIALKDLGGNVSPKDISFITNLTNTTIENYNQIDYIISEFVKTKRLHQSIRCLLMLAICEVEFLNTPDGVVVNEYVNLCKDIGKEKLSGFSNAVLRNYTKNRDSIVYPDIEQDVKSYLNLFSSYPMWFIDEIIDDYGVEFASNFFLYKNPNKGYNFVRLNSLQGTKEDILKEIKNEGLEYSIDNDFEDGILVKNLTNIRNRAVFTQGKIAVQGKASMLSVRLAGLEKNMEVLDACAAPGGKTGYISALLDNTGKIMSFDIHEHRVGLIEKNMQRLGALNVETKVFDASCYDADLREKFDVVFLDMPCSSLGLAYKKADIKLFKTKEDVLELAKIQKSIMNIAKSYVKKGGILMYITCSISSLETDLEWFFKKNKDYVEEKMDIPENIKYVEAKHGIKLFPHISDMDGFFICKIKRK